MKWAIYHGVLAVINTTFLVHDIYVGSSWRAWAHAIIAIYCAVVCAIAVVRLRQAREARP
jgi:hypothetical protein